MTNRPMGLCPLCGEHRSRELYRHRGRIVRCSNCGLVRRDPAPSPRELAAIYQSEEYFRVTTPGAIGYGDYYADEHIYRPYFQRKLKRLSRFRPPPGRLLEIGAAAGYALDEARNAGWDTQGLEISPSAARFARERFGLRVDEGGVEDLVADEEWDVILLFQTIEHVTDVRGTLHALRRALRRAGVLFITTPDHGSWIRKVSRRFWPSYRPEHVIYFDRRTLSTFLQQASFAVLDMASDDPLRVPLRRIVERVTHYYLRRRVEANFMPHLKFPVWLGDMEVIAQRSP